MALLSGHSYSLGMDQNTTPTNKLDPSAVVALRAQRRREFWQAAPESLHDRPTWAAVRHVGEATIEAEAIKGGGCPYIRIGRRALYRKADMLEWMERTGRRVENTAQLVEVAA